MQNENVTFVQDKLKGITNATHTSIVTMMKLALRERNARNGFTNITGIRNELIRMGEKIVDEDYLKFWQELETAGVGNLITGRRGNSDRFKWHYSLKEISKNAIEGKEVEIQELAKKVEVKQSALAVKRGPGRPKGYSPKKRGPGRPKGYTPKRKRMTSDAKKIERKVLEVLRQALLS